MNKPRTFLTVLTVLVGCNKNTGDSGGDIMLSGTIVPEGEDLSGEVAIVKAFAFGQGDSFLTYMSSNPNATCAKVTEYLVSDEPYDPVDILSAGKCNMFVMLSSGYESGFSASDDPLVAAGTAIDCAMGDGAFELTTMDEDDTDYYWTGRWFQSHPTAYTYEISGGDGSDFEFGIEMSEYQGGFIYEVFETVNATGDVSGTVQAQWCASLGSTGLLR